MNTIFCSSCGNRIYANAPCPFCLAARKAERRYIRSPRTRRQRDSSPPPKGWAHCFRLIEKAGGPRLPHWRRLTVVELFVVCFNPWALFLGPFYFVSLGMFKQGVAVGAVGLFLPSLVLTLLKQLPPQHAQPVLSALSGTGWVPWLLAWFAGTLIGAAVRVNRDFYGYWRR